MVMLFAPTQLQVSRLIEAPVTESLLLDRSELTVELATTFEQ
jgi:hypothetical protein